MSLKTPDKIRNVQRKLYLKAKAVLYEVPPRGATFRDSCRVPLGEASRKA